MTDLPPIHASEMKLYQACPRKWQYVYLDKLPPAYSQPLHTGTLVHQWLSKYWAGELSGFPDDGGVAEACCRAYAAHYPLPEKGKYRTEAPFEGTVGGVPVAGTVDAVHSEESVVIVEHKTTSQDIGPTSDYWASVVTCDIQVSMYLSALNANFVLYNVIRKPTLRQKKDETDLDFMFRCVDQMTAEPEKFFRQGYIVRFESERERFAEDLIAVDRLRRGGHHPRNAASCFSFGRRCEFWDHCWGAP